MRYFYLLIIFLSFIFSIDIGLDGSLKGNEIETYNSTANYSNNQNSLLHNYIDVDEYITGPGDIFLFNMVTSSRIVNLELVVSPSGTILIPIVGVVDVKNKTISYVYDAIIKKCKEKYADSNVYVELIKTRFFKVLVTGDFNSTGMFPVSATNRVSDLIESMLNLERKEHSFSIVDSLLHKYFSDYSKNILLTKDIFLIRNSSSAPNVEIIEVDLFNYYLNGDFSSNPILKEGDVINIKNSNKVAVLGDIQKPIRINLENNMSYGYLVNLAIKKNENQNIAKVINYKMLNQYSNNEIDRISEIEEIQ